MACRNSKGGDVLSKITVIANPSSGHGDAESIITFTKNRFYQQGIRPIIHLTKDKDDIITYAQQACENKVDKVFLIGGDGTISIYMNAIRDMPYRPELAIVPTGTLNNVARALKISLDPQEAVDQLIDGSAFKADMGLINGKVFTSTISAGCIPESTWQVTEEEKDQYGNLAYLFGGLESLSEKEGYEYKIEIDGQSYQRKLDLLVIGISGSIIGFTNFFQNASYHDHRLHLFALEDGSGIKKTIELTKFLVNQKPKQNAKNNNFLVRDFREIKIDLINDTAHVTVDGEKGPEFPLVVKVLPGFIDLTIPKSQS